MTTTPFVDGLDSPVFVTHAGDGTGMLYVVEQGGRILVVAPDGSVADQPFLDIGERIVAGGERGLLGLAFHPDYPSDDRFFVMYTAADAGANTVAEFHARDGAADPASERVLLSIADFAGNHNGGMVAFGPDGYLYAGTGDGGGGGDPEQNGQDSHALLGKILRIDVDGEPEDGLPYAIPADNPARLGMDFAPEVWALGLRNPWRFSFDREIGNLWIGDVGQNAWEEIDATPIDRPGLNFGWNIMEGPACYDTARCDETGLALPVSSYELLSDECAVIGGYVYRGEAVPEAQGVYLFGDYCDGRIRGLDAAAAIDRISGQEVDLLQTEATLSAFGEDEAGESYAVDLNGSILRIGLSLRD